MKRFFAIVLVGLMLTLAFTPVGEAWERHHRGRYGRGHGGDGAAIGLGVGLLVGTLFGAAIAAPPPVVAAPVPAPAPVYLTQPTVIYAPSGPRWVPGYWETRWVPSTTQLQVSVPGHYDPYGNWISGHYQSHAIQSGTRAQVWVPGHWE